jgi:SH3-like domain-containing protein
MFCSIFVFTACNTFPKGNTKSIPRIANLKSSKVKLHVGPGIQYPTDWILTLKHMPVIIVSEFGQWRRIKICDGTVGWVHKSLLSYKKKVILQSEAILFASDSDVSKKTAKIGKNVVVEIIKCKDIWTKIIVETTDKDKLTGYVKTKLLWGLRTSD